MTAPWLASVLLLLQGRVPTLLPSPPPPALNDATTGSRLARFLHLGSADRLRYWLNTIGRFSAWQIVMQFFGLATGLLLVRALPKADYALYTIVNTMQGTMGVLADAGISIALSAIGGKVWQDRRRLGELVNTALRARLRLAVVVGICMTPVLAWMLWHNGASLRYGAALVAVVLVGLYYQLSLDVFIIVPRLHSQVARLQHSSLLVTALRLGLIAAFLAVFVNALIAAAIATLCGALQCWQISRWAREHADPDAPDNPGDKKEITRKIRHLLPSAIFYCIQGQMLVLLMTLTGRNDHVADVGALGRVAALFDVFGSILISIVLPAFTRCQDPALLKRRYFQIVGGYAVLGAAMTGFAVLAPAPLLWVLGSKYAGLRHELILIVANMSVSTFAGTMWSVNAARGWVHYNWLEIPTRLLLQAGLLLVINPSTVSGAIYFLMLSQLSPIAFNAGLTAIGFRTLRREHAAATIAA